MADRLLKPKKIRWTKGAMHWREGDTAFISVVFSWDLLQARKIAEYYRSIGCAVRAGGPGTFTHVGKKVLGDVAAIGGRIPDTVFRHHPLATRASYGCPVGCAFCIVTPMDGKEFTLVPDFIPRPILCDDNISALPAEYQKHIIDMYQRANVEIIDANSGFEPRTFDDEVFARWRPVLKGPWRFGYDEATEGQEVARVFRMLKDISPRRKQVYTMIGREPVEVCMDRILRVISSGGEPYAQPFIKLNALTKEAHVMHDWTTQKLADVARWVNRHLWRKTSFADYDRTIDNRRPRPANISSQEA